MTEDLRKSKRSNKKGVGYYFRIEFRTIQGKITTGFVALGLLALGMLLITSWYYNRLLDQYKIVDKNYRALIEMADDLSLQAARQLVALHQKDSLFLPDSKSRIQDAGRLIRQVDLPNAEIIFDEAEADFLAIVTYLDRDSPSSPDFFTNLSSMVTTFNEKLTEFRTVVHARLDAFEEDIRQREGKLKWILGVQFSLALILGVLIGSIILFDILKRIRQIKSQLRELGKGNIPPKSKESRDELNAIIKAINSLTDNLADIKKFAGEVGNGDFSSDVTVFNNQGELGESLAEMRNSLKNVAEEANERTFLNDGINKLSEIIRLNNDDFKQLASRILSFITDYIDSVQAGFFVVDEEGEKPVLRLMSFYAYSREKFKKSEILPGEGLVGQVFQEKKKVLLKKVPDNFSPIATATGEMTPQSVVVTPLIYEEHVYGVMEFAFAREYRPREENFIQEASQIIAASLSSVINNERMKKVIEESQEQNTRLREKEEQMRQNTEELEATQEQIERQAEESSELKEMYESLMNSVQGVFYRSFKDGRDKSLFVTDNIKAILGFSAEEVTAGDVSLSSRIPEDELKEISRVQEEAVRERTSFDHKFHFRKKDGTLIDIHDKGRPVFKDGELFCIDGVFLVEND